MASSLMNRLDISVPEMIGNQIYMDAVHFEIFKGNGQINRNKLLRMLIVGYYDEYDTNVKRKLNRIETYLSESRLTKTQKQELANSIIRDVVLNQAQDFKPSKSMKLSLKPSKDMSTLMKRIKSNVIDPDSLSAYLCKMLISYCSLPFSRREIVIFKDNYDCLMDYCNSETPIVFSTTWDPDSIHEVIPYRIITGREEMYNYLLCAEFNTMSGKQETIAYRMNRMINIEETAIDYSIEPEVRKHLEKMVEMHIQYVINDDEEICVKLNQRGVRSYRNIYFGRPDIYKTEIIDGIHYYYYRGSTEQVYFYFRRFGSDAEIVYPLNLRERIERFHSSAADVYKSDVKQLSCGNMSV